VGDWRLGSGAQALCDVPKGPERQGQMSWAEIHSFPAKLWVGAGGRVQTTPRKPAGLDRL